MNAFPPEIAGVADPGYNVCRDAKTAKAKKSPSPPFCSNRVLLNAIHP